MRPAFLTLCWVDGAKASKALAIADRAAVELGFTLALDRPNLLVLVNDTCRTVSMDADQGVVLGDLFRRSSSGERVHALDPEETRRVLTSDGDALMERYWGEYVALLASERIVVLRDPSAGLSAFASAIDGITLLYSDIGVLLDLELIAAQIDWSSVHRRVTIGEPRPPRTCLKNVREIAPGSALIADGGSWRERTVWDPWKFASRDEEIGDRSTAVDGLRDALTTATRSLAGCHDKCLVELSGGLDSSIIATCLAETGIEMRCVNLMTIEPGADERRYAEAMAASVKAPLRVVALHASDFDFAHGPAARGPWPSDHPLRQLIDDALKREALELDVDSFFSGSGGDYVLAYLGTSAPAADALLRFGPGPRFGAAVANLAELHRTSIWKAGHLALRKAWTRTHGPSEPPPEFVLPPRDQDFERHPWFPAPPEALPGKVQQVQALAYGQSVRECRDRVDIGPQRMPIWSQPVVEHCLRTPTWMSVSGGRNRAVARDAFADRLPDIVLNRRTKGNFTGLIAAVYDRNRSKVMDLLASGLLVENGVLDQARLSEYLTTERAPSDIVFTQILQIASTELWARSWSDGSNRGRFRRPGAPLLPRLSHA